MRHKVAVGLFAGIIGWLLGWIFFHDNSLNFYIVTAIVVFLLYPGDG